jgi:FkbM family methyltransferase
MKKLFRSIQVFFPFLQDIKYKIKFTLMNTFKFVHEDDFKLMKWFEPNAKQVFIDIGSNRGEALTSMLLMNKSETKIIGFEPNFEVFKRLQNYISKRKNVNIHNLGLGNKNKESKLFIPFYRKWMFDGLASFNYECAKDWLTKRMFLYNEKKLTIKESKCKIKILDDYKLNPYFIKIDVQGLELEVLQGGINTLTRNLPILLIESLTKECVKYLSPLGYKFYCFNNDFLSEGIGDLNTFCIDLERHPELKKIVK